MIPIKVECGCGQRYAFEVNPVDGHMPQAVKCPSCGADGTLAANQVIAQILAVPARAPVAVPIAPVAPTGGGMRIAVSGAATAPAVAAVAPPPPPMSSPKPIVRPAPAAKPAADGWDVEETQVNKLGTFVIVGPVIFAALFASGIFGVQVAPSLLLTVVAVCGVLGGVLNISGRGPVVAGAIVGLVIAVGGYGAVYWWIQGRESVRKFELIIAFVVGVIPGFLLQTLLQAYLRKRAQR
jgi:hypothetical protein